MIVPGAVELRFRNAEPYLRHVQTVVRETVATFCDREGFAFQSRPKTVESVAEKIETGRFSRWSDLDDLYACAIIIPSLPYEAAAIGFLREAFQETRLTRRGSMKKDPTVFRFECTRFVGRLRLPGDGVESPMDLRDTCFEVQVRTAFEHAWQVATHSFTYKSASVEWRRLRLAAQLKASVEQLDNLILLLEQAAEHVVESHWDDVEARGMLLAFFKERFEQGALPSETKPKDWTRFCDNVIDLLKAYGPRQGPIDAVTQTIAVLARAFDAGAPGSHPLSVSLWQYVFGVLTAAHLLTPVKGKYRPLITEELRVLYPEVASFTESFDLAS